RDFELFEGKLPSPDLPTPEIDHPAIGTWRAAGGTASISENAMSKSRAAYYGLVSMIDRLFGQIEAHSGPCDNTVTIYASDHGECLGERGLWWKSVMYDESAKVPMIIRGTGFDAGRIDTRVTSLMDLSATILALAGASLPEHTGNDLRNSDDWPNTIYSEYYGGLMNIELADVRHRMIRQGRYKLIHYEGYDPQLFDLENDPRELENLFGDPAYSNILDELTRLVLRDWNPTEIARRQAINLKRMSTIKAWVRETGPPEPMRWKDPRPERNAYE
ncbi:MAG: sulfatase/phosphatase domain-containing protein, partial [Hyphomicrobiales bacterium]